MTRFRNLAIGLLIVALTIFLVWTQLPGRTFSGDLSRIGQGQPALVLAFENHTPASLDTMALLQDVRADYEPELLFLVADVSVPEGRSLTEQHDAFSGVIMLFDADGGFVDAYPPPRSSDAIRGMLADTLGLRARAY